jgi:hypothetical protein
VKNEQNLRFILKVAPLRVGAGHVGEQAQRFPGFEKDGQVAGEYAAFERSDQCGESVLLHEGVESGWIVYFEMSWNVHERAKRVAVLVRKAKENTSRKAQPSYASRGKMPGIE